MGTYQIYSGVVELYTSTSMWQREARIGRGSRSVIVEIPRMDLVAPKIVGSFECGFILGRVVCVYVLQYRLLVLEHNNYIVSEQFLGRRKLWSSFCVQENVLRNYFLHLQLAVFCTATQHRVLSGSAPLDPVTRTRSQFLLERRQRSLDEISRSGIVRRSRRTSLVARKGAAISKPETEGGSKAGSPSFSASSWHTLCCCRYCLARTHCRSTRRSTTKALPRVSASMETKICCSILIFFSLFRVMCCACCCRKLLFYAMTISNNMNTE